MPSEEEFREIKVISHTMIEGVRLKIYPKRDTYQNEGIKI